MSAMIPAKLDIEQILDDLERWGWLRYKIEVYCGMSAGYVTRLRDGGIQNVSYVYGARLHNLWVSESESAQNRLVCATTA
jgi:hypothetical protein